MLPQLEQAIDTWEQWKQPICTAPQVKERLMGGLTNVSFHVEAGGHAYVIRVHNPKSRLLGIHRDREAKILWALSGSGIAPEPVYFDEAEKFSVLKYVPGRAWTEEDLNREGNRARLRELIDTYQSVPVPIVAIDYIAYLDQYWSAFTKVSPRAAETNFQRWNVFRNKLRSYQVQNTRRHLVHHDLVPQNIIEDDNGLRLIDWEYASLGYAELDYLYLGLNLNNMQKTADQARDSSVLIELYRWLSELWRAIQSQQIAGHADLNND
ncbi:MAG: phosphotransferase family protein [Agarilytica sp.]